MGRYRLSLLAQADIAQILDTSTDRWGTDGRRRYEMLLAAAMRKVAADPEGPTTRDRAGLSRGLRSFHLRNARAVGLKAKVRRPVHVLYYREVRPGLIEIVRVIHERMEPSRHLREESQD
jgi:toxin ParE1/3/4